MITFTPEELAVFVASIVGKVSDSFLAAESEVAEAEAVATLEQNRVIADLRRQLDAKLAPTAPVLGAALRSTISEHLSTRAWVVRADSAAGLRSPDISADALVNVVMATLRDQGVIL